MGELWTGTAAAQPVWTQVTDSDVDGKQVTGLFVAGPRLFAATMESETSYSLYSSASGASGSFDPTGISGKGKPVNQVTFDGAEYYAAVSTQLIRGDAAAGTMTTDATPGAVGGAIIGGVYYSPGCGAGTTSRLRTATCCRPPTGNNPASWTGVTGIEVSGTTVRFNRIGEVGASPEWRKHRHREHGARAYQLVTTGAWARTTGSSTRPTPSSTTAT